jgi:DNA gyrase subunit A
MEVGMVEKIDIDREMQQAYLDYAMSVIVARALPDARDGLKPVHRRILYAMHDMGIRSDSTFKKSARIVGEVLGKYHPHGDMAVYEAMARMAQDFSMRYLLVDGQGNFGSVDGDPPAAMRYTEARLAAPAMTMLTDIQKNTVNFSANFDGTLNEPNVLPAALPNLLVNGATGIAVGMATNIPPHNLGEVIDALNFMLEKWEKLDDITLDDLMQFIQGPDFPTGGVIFHDAGLEDEGLRSAYGSGRGRVTVQAHTHLEEMERGKNRIIVTELPYMTNKASLIERIAELVRDEKLEGIADLRDESDRHGMRIVIELSKTVEPENILRELYKQTPMQSTFSITLLALVEGEPRLLTLKGALRVYLEHRLEIIRRRSEYDLERARARAHILEGLRIALQNLDEVIDLIRKSPDVDTARARLMKRFKLSEIQAQAILDMPLRRLAALERKKIEEEYKEVQALIKELESLLKSPKKMRSEVSQELLAVKESFNDARRTRIINLTPGVKKTSLLTAQDLMPEQVTWISLTIDGLIARSKDEKPPRLSGKDAPLFLIQSGTRDTLFLVGDQGDTAAIAVHALPETDEVNAGVPFWKVSPLKEEHLICGLFSLPAKERPEDRFLLTVSRKGMVKKTALSELPGPSASTLMVAKVNTDDQLLDVLLTDGKQDIILATAGGMGIRFAEEEVRPMGLVAAGVMGMKLATIDEIVGCAVVLEGLSKPDPELLLVTSGGSAKRITLQDFPRQGRYGQGVIVWKLSRQNRLAGMAPGKGTDRVILHFNRLAAKNIRLDEAPLQNRSSQGKPLQEFKAGDTITLLAVPRQYGRTQQAQPETAKSAKSSPAQKPTKKTGAKAAEKPVDQAGAKGSTPAAKTPGEPAKPVKKTTAQKATPAPTQEKKAPKKPAQKSAVKKPTPDQGKATGAPAKTVQKPAVKKTPAAKPEPGSASTDTVLPKTPPATGKK